LVRVLGDRTGSPLPTIKAVVRHPCSEVPLPVSKSTTTHHFRVLREAGVIRQVYRGTSKMNGLRRADLDALFPGLLDRVLAAAAAQEDRLSGS
jgi:DNA-binding transcriptional ArsR family regulator